MNEEKKNLVKRKKKKKDEEKVCPNAENLECSEKEKKKEYLEEIPRC